MTTADDTAPEMHCTALAGWAGGKRRIAPWIVSHFGEHDVFWDIPCGSMAVLLSKPPCRMETVVDLHGDVLNLARVVQKEETAVELYARLSRTLMAQGLFEDEVGRLREVRSYDSDELDVDRAYAYFLASWIGMGGVAGTAAYNMHFAARYTKKGGHAATRFTNAVESIPAWHDRLRGVTIMRRDLFDVLWRIRDDRGTVIYIDPPYIDKGFRYFHDFDLILHARLASVVKRFRHAKVIISYYPDPVVDALYGPEWDRATIDVSKAMVSAGSRDVENDVRATEMILCNQPLERGSDAPMLFEATEMEATC